MKSNIQKSADRAMAEQAAVIRCLESMKKSLDKWSRYNQSSSMIIGQLGSKYDRIMRQALTEFSQFQETLNELVVAFDDAENARIQENSSLSSSSKDRITKVISLSPVDYLVRGSAGVEVANLINVLRANRKEFQDMIIEMKKYREKLIDTVKSELDILKRTKEELISENNSVNKAESEVLNSAKRGRSPRSRANI